MIRISSRCFSVSSMMKRPLFRGVAPRSGLGADHRATRATAASMSSIVELFAANVRAVNSLSGAASSQLVGRSSATTRAQMPAPVCLF